MKAFEIPTDNLYKFIAISGILIILACLIFPGRYAFELMLEAEVIHGQIQLAEQNLKVIETELDSPHIPMDAEDLKKIENLRALRKESIDKSFQLDIDNELLKKKLKYLNWVLFLAIPFCFFGLFLACKGFYLWKTKLQKYQDMIVKNEAEKLLMKK